MLLICCGMPRSGSTLQFNAAWKIAEAGGLGSRVVWQSSKDWARADSDLSMMAADDKIHVIKMHFPPDNVKALAEAGDQVRFVYVHRDIRDVVYSMKTKFNFTLSRAILRVSQALDAEKWLLDNRGAQVLIQDYALLFGDLTKALTQIAGFVGAEIDDDAIATFAEELSVEVAYDKSRQSTLRFEHLRRRINRLLGRKVFFANTELMLHPNHVSEHRGQIGIGVQELSSNDLAAIDSAFGSRVSGIADDR